MTRPKTDVSSDSAIALLCPVWSDGETRVVFSCRGGRLVVQHPLAEQIVATLRRADGSKSLRTLAEEGSLSIELLSQVIGEGERRGAVAVDVRSARAIAQLCANPQLFQLATVAAPSKGNRPEATETAPRRVASSRSFRSGHVLDPAQIDQMRTVLSGAMAGTRGSRSFPSAGGLYGLSVVGSFLRPTGEHELVQLTPSSPGLAFETRWRAPVASATGLPGCGEVSGVVVLVADLDRMSASYGTRAFQLACIEAGSIVQLIYELGYENGFMTSGWNGYDDEWLAECLGLGSGCWPITTLVVGQSESGSGSVAVPRSTPRRPGTSSTVVSRPTIEAPLWVIASAGLGRSEGFGVDGCYLVASEKAVAESVERTAYQEGLVPKERPDGMREELWSPAKGLLDPDATSNDADGRLCRATDVDDRSAVKLPQLWLRNDPHNGEPLGTVGLAAARDLQIAQEASLNEAIERACLHELLNTSGLCSVDVVPSLVGGPDLRVRIRVVRVWGRFVALAEVLEGDGGAVSYWGAACAKIASSAKARSVAEAQMVGLNDSDDRRQASPQPSLGLVALPSEIEDVEAAEVALLDLEDSAFGSHGLAGAWIRCEDLAGSSEHVILRCVLARTPGS